MDVDDMNQKLVFAFNLKLIALDAIMLMYRAERD